MNEKNEADVPERHDTFPKDTSEEVQYEDKSGENNPAGRKQGEKVPADRPGDQKTPSEKRRG